MCVCWGTCLNKVICSYTQGINRRQISATFSIQFHQMTELKTTASLLELEPNNKSQLELALTRPEQLANL